MPNVSVPAADPGLPTPRVIIALDGRGSWWIEHMDGAISIATVQAFVDGHTEVLCDLIHDGLLGADRRRLELAVDVLIDALDTLDTPAEDLEPEEDADATADDPRGEADAADDEPSLGAPENPHSQLLWGQGGSAHDDEEGEDGLPPSYLPVENSHANQAVAARLERQALALSERKLGMRPTQLGNIGPLVPILSLVP